MTAERNCGWCGAELEGQRHAACESELEPQRFCRSCGRRVAVQILPTGSVTKPCVCVTRGT